MTQQECGAFAARDVGEELREHQALEEILWNHVTARVAAPSHRKPASSRGCQSVRREIEPGIRARVVSQLPPALVRPGEGFLCEITGILPRRKGPPQGSDEARPMSLIEVHEVVLR